jgi:hypothetical protein
MTKRDRTLRDLAARHGRTVMPTRGGHIMLIRPGCQPVYAASSPSCWRARRNLEALLRRHDRLAERG